MMLPAGTGLAIVDRSTDRLWQGRPAVVGQRPATPSSGVTIYHNPRCGTSRNVLRMIRNSGIEPTIVEYLKTPPNREGLRALITATGMPVRDVLRVKGASYRMLGLDQPARTDEELIDAMVAHPLLINRPIVATPKGTRLCRPSDLVLELLPEKGLPFTKEEGVSALLSEAADVDCTVMQVLADAGLPTRNLGRHGHTLLRFRLPQQDIVGYGGYDLFGREALLHSITVLPAHRYRGLGRNLMLLLMRRAFDVGARQAYVATAPTNTWLERVGFTPVRRPRVPEVFADADAPEDLFSDDVRVWTRSVRP